MLPIKYIRENKTALEKAAKDKNIELDFDELLRLDDERRAKLGEVDELRNERNELAAGKSDRPTDEQIERGRQLKEAVSQKEEQLRKIEERWEKLMVQVPTIPSADTPVGQSEAENVEIERWGKPTQFDFKPKDHLRLGKDLDIIDFERGVKVAGYRGYYMKNEGASLQLALMMYAMEKLVAQGFQLMIPPTLVKEFALFGSGYFAGKEYDGTVDEIYKIANRDLGKDGRENKESKFLIGTAEPALLAYYSGEVLQEENLPLKLCGFSQCYRSEIGSYGKDTKGLYRVHEFMKVEQVCLCPADKDEADKLQEEMVAISKQLHREIGLPHRVLQICTGDMSAGKYRMFDLEAWMPSRNGYGETGSASNFLDWQSRRLNVRYQTKEGKKEYVYMLNNTAIPSPRFIIAILENFQQADGSVVIPEVLRKFMPRAAEKIEVKK